MRAVTLHGINGVQFDSKRGFSGSVVGMLTDCSAVGGGLGGDGDRVARWSQTGLHQTAQTVLVRIPYTQNIPQASMVSGLRRVPIFVVIRPAPPLLL